MQLKLLMVLAMMGVTTLPGSAVHAQSDTPTPGSAGTADCTGLEPRDAEYFQALSGTPAAATADGAASQAAAATPTQFAMSEGEPADEAVVGEVTALYEQLIACLNARDYLRVYALYSDEYLERNFSEEMLNTLAATPVPTEASTQSAFGGVREARILDDGRVGALITTSNPQSGEVVVFALRRRDGDRLRIDDEQVVDAETSPGTAEATPAA